MVCNSDIKVKSPFGATLISVEIKIFQISPPKKVKNIGPPGEELFFRPNLVFLRVEMVPLSGGVDLSEDGKVFGEIVKVESLRCDRIELSVLVVFRRKEGSDDPFSDRIEVDLEEKGFPMG